MDDEDYGIDVYNDGQRELEDLNYEGKKRLISCWESTHDKLTSLLCSLHHYCQQIPVLMFTSAKYDLNLVKSRLTPRLRCNIDPKKAEDHDTCDVSVIKKGSTYT